MFEDMKNVCSQLEHQMGGRMFRAAAHGKLPRMQDLLNDEELLRLRQSIQAWRTGPQPSIVTHDLVDDAADPILQHFRHRHMFNSAEDPVKVIFHPEFVTATSPLFNLDYQQFVRGCHMGIFPSYYEPWGYTPMECVALGLPSITTDLSGFGAYARAPRSQRGPSRYLRAQSPHEKLSGNDQQHGRLPDELRADEPPTTHRDAQPSRTAQRTV